MIESRKMGDSTRGWAIELGNIKAATVRDNIISNDGGRRRQRGDQPRATAASVPNTSEGVGINDLVIEDNVVRKWQVGMVARRQPAPRRHRLHLAERPDRPRQRLPASSTGNTTGSSSTRCR